MDHVLRLKDSLGRVLTGTGTLTKRAGSFLWEGVEPVGCHLLDVAKEEYPGDRTNQVHKVG